tara:strand:+ start:40 stop:474 length:435 start_codon:yes stop_codon:yes gene_type:complete
MNRPCSIALVLSFFLSVLLSNIEPVPLIKLSYDKNLGLTYGFGVSIVKFKEGIGQGIYSLISYSKEKKGKNVSFGFYSGLGLVSFRVGINRMEIAKQGKSKVLWGLEGSPTLFVFHLNAGVMIDREKQNNSKYHLNLAGGAGMF